jgi:DNA replication protein DnaC
VLFITAGKLFDILRKYALNQINDIDILLNTEVLLIDDLGSEPMFNNITNEFLFLLINERTRNKMPLFISTNLLPTEIKNHYNERIASRLLDKSITNIISLPGSDLRLR